MNQALLLQRSDLINAAAGTLRAQIRLGHWTGPTSGLAHGYVQTNLVILPGRYADEFAEFCARNPRPCPLIAQTKPGDPCPAAVAPGSDLRTDVPRYRIFRHGVAEQIEPTEIRDLWRADFVGFLLGCSFTFEHALIAAGLPVRHIQEQKNVPMYRTSIDCQPAGPFAGPLVVSMRPYRLDQIEAVSRITSEFLRMHGGPVHYGDPQAIGIEQLERPDFGDAVTIEPGEIPVFWACGVTPQLALSAARPDLCITHSPGCMFVTDCSDASFRDPSTNRES